MVEGDIVERRGIQQQPFWFFSFRGMKWNVLFKFVKWNICQFVNWTIHWENSRNDSEKFVTQGGKPEKRCFDFILSCTRPAFPLFCRYLDRLPCCYVDTNLRLKNFQSRKLFLWGRFCHMNIHFGLEITWAKEYKNEIRIFLLDTFDGDSIIYSILRKIVERCCLAKRFLIAEYWEETQCHGVKRRWSNAATLL